MILFTNRILYDKIQKSTDTKDVRSEFKGECPFGLCERIFVRTFYRIYRVSYSSIRDDEIFCDIVRILNPMQMY